MPKQLGGKATSKRPAANAAATKRPAAKAAVTKPQASKTAATKRPASKAAATKRPASKAAAMKRPAASQQLGKKIIRTYKVEWTRRKAAQRPAASVDTDLSPVSLKHFVIWSPPSLPDDLSAVLQNAPEPEIAPQTPEHLLSVAVRHLREHHGLSDQEAQQLIASFETDNNDSRS